MLGVSLALLLVGFRAANYGRQNGSVSLSASIAYDANSEILSVAEVAQDLALLRRRTSARPSAEQSPE
jgi:hypothetical protein